MLGRIGPVAVPALSALFKEEDRSLQSLAAFVLHAIGAAAVPPLVESLQGGDVESRRIAARALVMEPPAAKTALPALTTALKDPDYYVRLFAAAAVGMIGPDAAPAVPALCECLRDSQLHMQNEAAGALGQIGPAAKDAIPDLIRALIANSAGTYASQALVEIGPAAVPALTAVLKGGEERARSRAAEALKNMDSKAVAKTGAKRTPTVSPRRP